MNTRLFRFSLVLAVPLTLLLLSGPVWARVGGGESYGGSGGGGGGGGGGEFAGELIYLVLRVLFWLNIEHPAIGIPVDIIIVIGLIWLYTSMQNAKTPAAVRTVAPTRTSSSVPERLQALRQDDPNFSEYLFTDFAYSLYARVQEARGRRDLALYSPYLAPKVIERLQSLTDGLKDVTGVIVGASRIIRVSKPGRATVSIVVEFETNYTELREGLSDGDTCYSHEQWTFNRKRDVLSRPPEKVTAINCPSCGGALERNPDGSCKHCGVKVVGGDFDWFVTEVAVLERKSQGPLLTQDVVEGGTDEPTVMQPGFGGAMRRFKAVNADFTWPKMEERIRSVFLALQQAWSDGDWEKARPHESDCLFQTHLFWIQEYRRQRLRNVLEDIHIGRIEPVKVVQDGWYDALTVRIFARMIDYTQDEQGKVVRGNKNRAREFTEYWTFIRRRGAKETDKGENNCPNCGALLKINMAGVCAYCRSKVTSGEFDWVLSRIEQDEAYHG